MAEWARFEAADGLVRVWLPPGEELESSPGYDYWSPDPELGRFTVVRGDGDGDALLAAEREGGAVQIERDERLERGGMPVRHLRYRSSVEIPRDIVERPGGGRMHVGGTTTENLSDVLFANPDGEELRAGYSVVTSAPEPVRAVLAEVFERLEIGDER